MRRVARVWVLACAFAGCARSAAVPPKLHGQVVLPAAESPSLEGTVRDATGNLVARASVVLVSEAGSIATRTDANGVYRLSAPAGSYKVAVAHASCGALAAALLTLKGAARRDVVLEEAPLRLRGTAVIDGRPAADDSLVAVVREGGDATYFGLVERGEYSIALPSAQYSMLLAGRDILAAGRDVEPETTGPLDLVASRIAPPSAGAQAWVAQHEIPLTGTDPGASIDDLRPMAKIIGDARVVGLGEATHGTREMSRAKHRMIRALVENQGFDTVAVEAPYAAVVVANDFVVNGVGNLRGAVAAGEAARPLSHPGR